MTQPPRDDINNLVFILCRSVCMYIFKALNRTSEDIITLGGGVICYRSEATLHQNRSPLP